MIKIQWQKSRIIFYFLLLLILPLIFSCTKIKAYLLDNPNYYSIFYDQKKIYETLKKKMLRYFLSVREIRTNSTASYLEEINTLIGKKLSGVVFLPNYYSPLLIKNPNLTADTQLKLVTYNLPEMDEDLPLLTFNVGIDPQVMADKIILLLRRYSGQKKEFTDCGVIINPSFSLCTQLTAVLEKKGVKPEVLEVQIGFDSIIMDWLLHKERKAVIFMGYGANKILSNLPKERFKKTVLIEALTHYGEINSTINYSIDINWPAALDYAFNSSDFRKFITSGIKDNKLVMKSNLYNFIVRNRNTINISKYKIDFPKKKNITSPPKKP